MTLTSQRKAEIDGMSLKEMLSLWRFAPAGNEMFQGESGEYFSKVMNEKRNASAINTPGEWTRISKEIGW